MTYWYVDEKNVIELAEFLVQSEEISTTDELLDFFKYPEKYTDVWKIYEEQILGKTVHIGFSQNGQFDINKQNTKSKSPITTTHIGCACSEK